MTRSTKVEDKVAPIVLWRVKKPRRFGTRSITWLLVYLPENQYIQLASGVPTYESNSYATPYQTSQTIKLLAFIEELQIFLLHGIASLDKRMDLIKTIDHGEKVVLAVPEAHLPEEIELRIPLFGLTTHKNELVVLAIASDKSKRTISLFNKFMTQNHREGFEKVKEWKLK